MCQINASNLCEETENIGRCSEVQIFIYRTSLSDVPYNIYGIKNYTEDIFKKQIIFTIWTNQQLSQYSDDTCSKK